MDTKEGMISVEGGKVWYKITGAGHPGTPLLVLHGGPGATHDYLLPLDELADQRPVIFYDQLGGGNSDRPENSALWTLPRFVAELAAVRDALNLSMLHILGQSWGTMLAVEYAASPTAPGVKSLILSAPYLDSRRWERDARRNISELPAEMQVAIEKAEANGNYSTPEYQAATAEYYARHLCRINPWPEEMNLTFSKMGLPVYQQMWGPSEFTVTGTLRNQDSTPLLGRLTLPILFTAGHHDEATPEAAEHFLNLTKNGRLAVFENASHQHHLEQREEYLRTVRSFLAEVDGR